MSKDRKPDGSVCGMIQPSPTATNDVNGAMVSHIHSFTGLYFSPSQNPTVTIIYAIETGNGKTVAPEPGQISGCVYYIC